jgi:hypothetical protein
MLIIGVARYPNLRTHGLITIIPIPGMAGDFIPVFTLGTPDFTDLDSEGDSAEASADRAEPHTCAKVARMRRAEPHGHLDERHAPLRP